MNEGPDIYIKGWCINCKYVSGESYTCQSDSGTDWYCNYGPIIEANGGKPKSIPMCSNTPNWCPFLFTKVKDKYEEMAREI